MREASLREKTTLDNMLSKHMRFCRLNPVSYKKSQMQRAFSAIATPAAGGTCTSQTKQTDKTLSAQHYDVDPVYALESNPVIIARHTP